MSERETMAQWGPTGDPRSLPTPPRLPAERSPIPQPQATPVQPLSAPPPSAPSASAATGARPSFAPPQGWQAPPPLYPAQWSPQQQFRAAQPGWPPPAGGPPGGIPGMPPAGRPPAPGPRPPWQGPPGSWQQPGWQSPRPPQQPTDPSRPFWIAVIIGLVLVGLVGGGVLLATGDDPGPGPTTVRTPSPTPTPEWKNEDYQPPALQNPNPALPPARETTMQIVLEDNNLYQEKLAAPVRCQLPRKDLKGVAPQVLEKHLEQQLECLLRVWGPALEEAGFEVTRPTVTVFTQRERTPCGRMRMGNAMYCALDQNIYFANDLLEVARLDDAQWAIEAIMAHEFAHAVQGRAGIITARNLAAKQATKEHEQLLLVRRNEAQADCMATMFFASVRKSLKLTRADETQIVKIFEAVGSDSKGPRLEESTHPTMATRKAWAKKGFAATSIGACNSYVVPESEVA